MQGNLALGGFMGVGKSTIGKVIAAKSGYQFIDSDVEISQKLDMSISDIFQEYGEVYFRQHESSMISDLTCKKNIVLALGGGTLHHQDNLKKIESAFTIIVLDAPFQFLKYRIKDRPLFSNAQSLYNKRRKELCNLPYHVNVRDRGIHEIADECISIWKAAA